ncbi:hypothetical protein PDE_05198 [Penicillium oxalicum 114-2]|uniref:Methyltransferase domain-containing protein n=1 Tax=Penicillium oxalicum (strain 114-2 / CGMCC 5302) TaxID=933388 RepID=S8AVH1_PENO1|nr:hypothetical protein PDE_05198 [Penicillium oxalicum 114-2]
MEDHTQIKADIKKAYDAIAPKYFTWTQNTHKVRLSYVAKLLHQLDGEATASDADAHTTRTIPPVISTSPPPSAHILELGCGAGVPVTQLLAARPNTTVTANDISSAQIALARSHLPASDSLTLEEGDMMELNFAPESLDAVLAMYSIFHLPRTEQVTMLKRIHGWLKPGGWVLMNFAAGEVERVSDGAWLGGREGTMHWSGWGVERTRKIVAEEVGWKIYIDEVRGDDELEEDGSVKRVEFHWVMAQKPLSNT